MPPKKNPLKLNKLQPRTLVLERKGLVRPGDGLIRVLTANGLAYETGFSQVLTTPSDH